MTEILDEWQQLAAAASAEPWPALTPAQLARLEEVYEPGEWVQTLLRAGWPSEPLLVVGYHRLFWSVDELLAWPDVFEDWPREWFPLGAIGDRYLLFARGDQEGTSVWAAWSDGSGEVVEGRPVPEGVVWQHAAAFVRATRLSLTWITDDNFTLSTIGRWPLRRKELVLDARAEAAVRKECGAFSGAGPCLLPQLRGGIPQDLDEPLYQRRDEDREDG